MEKQGASVNRPISLQLVGEDEPADRCADWGPGSPGQASGWWPCWRWPTEARRGLKALGYLHDLAPRSTPTSSAPCGPMIWLRCWRSTSAWLAS
jgi:hypothetical protein